MYGTIDYNLNNVPSQNSALEDMISHYTVSPIVQSLYQPKHQDENNTYSSIYHQSQTFLKPVRPDTAFIHDAFEIQDVIRQAFEKTTAQKLPKDLIITIASREELSLKNIAFLNNSVLGITIHATKEIMVVSGRLDEVLLTVGHELGHAITPVANTPEEEEAKAYAFEAAWAQTIFEHDIAGLRNNINAASFLPAKNGLHDVAFAFVKQNFDTHSPLNLFNTLSQAGLSHQIAYTQITHPIHYQGYRNKSRVQNLPPPHNFFWQDLGRGVYGIYFPSTGVEILNERYLRQDIEQMHLTLGHEYSLHGVMQLPDGYVVEALEQAMFWIKEEEDKYSKKSS